MKSAAAPLPQTLTCRRNVTKKVLRELFGRTALIRLTGRNILGQFVCFQVMSEVLKGEYLSGHKEIDYWYCGLFWKIGNPV